MKDGIWLFGLWIHESRDFYLCFLRKVWIYQKKAHCSLRIRKLTYCWKDTRHNTWSATSQPLSVKLKKSITPLIVFVL